MIKTAVLLSFIGILLIGCQATPDPVKILDEYTFQTDDNYLESISAAQLRAQQQNKLLLLVLGASWCHDSSDLAKSFSNVEVDKILKQRFVTHFIDVGYFEDFHGVAQKFGYPGYFATPTVLVIDPSSQQILNRDSIIKWQNASKVPIEDYAVYFDEIGMLPPPDMVRSAQLTSFSAHQINRLKSAFTHFRTMWKAVRQNENSDSTELASVSEQVWSFRVQLQKDLDQLQTQLNQNPNSALTLPVYEKFSWE